MRVDRMGPYILGVVDFGKDASRTARGPAVSASYFEWALTSKRPNLPNGRLHLLYTQDRLYQFGPPRTFSASKAVTLRDALDGCPSDPQNIARKLHVNYGHASAQQLERVPVDSGGDYMRVLTCVDEVLEQR